MSEALKVAVEAALAAGKILRERKDDIGKVDYKAFYDPVTEVDLLCERTIIDRIKATFPDHDILAEESGSAEGNASTSKWIIDPLDGTLNFSHGYPCYCVSIGLELNGRVEVGVVYNPCLDELFVAERGQGATLNNKPIKVSTVPTLKESLLVTGFHPKIVNTLDDNLNHFCNFMKSCQAVRRPGSAAMDLVYTAMGRFEGFWELKLSPWDVAGGMLIVAEAGGTLTKFDGSPVTIYDEEILVSNGRVHQEMVDILQSGKA
jgi:myo-inositol-1(or 4)-monophosphatase